MEQDTLKLILNKLDKMDADIGSLKTGQQKLESDITDIKADITDIKKDTALIPLVQQAVSEVNQEVVATSAKVEQMHGTLKEHKVSLDILAARSLEQEAKLKCIK